MFRACSTLLLLWFLISILPYQFCLAVFLQDQAVEISDSQQRSWQSADGKFRQKGTLIEIQGDKIRLSTPEGKNMSVPLAKLSKEDRKFVDREQKRVAQSSPFHADAEESPFALEEDAPKRDGNPTAAEAEVVQVNFSMAKPILLQAKNSIDLSTERWKESDLSRNIDPIQIPCGSVHWNVNQCFSSSDNKYLIVSFHDPFGKTDDVNQPESGGSDFGRAFGGANKQMQRDIQALRERHNNTFPSSGNSASSRRSQNNASKSNWVELFELPKGERKGKYYVADQAEVSDFDTKRKQLLAASGKFVSEASIQFYEIENDQALLKKVCYGSGGFGNSAIHSARFLADGKVVVSLNDKLVVLNADTLKPMFACSNTNPDWRLAKDRRHAIIENQGRKFEIDLIDGKCVAAEGSKTGAGGMGAVSPDQKSTAEFSNRTVTIRDRKGKIESEFYVPVFWPEANLTWVDSQTLRAETPQNHLHFIDVKNRVALLEVMEMGTPMAANRGWTVNKAPTAGGEWFFTISPVMAVANDMAGLPSLEECRELLGGTKEDLQLLKKGDRVSMQIDLQADPSIAGEVQEIVENLMNSRGVLVDDSADDELRLESSASEETIEYKRFGSPPWDPSGVEKVTVRKVTSSLTLVREGKVVWSIGSSAGYPGFILHLKEGETAQQAADRQNLGPAEFWKNLKLPQHISIHPNGNAWARFQKTPDGYQPLK